MYGGGVCVGGGGRRSWQSALGDGLAGGGPLPPSPHGGAHMTTGAVGGKQSCESACRDGAGWRWSNASLHGGAQLLIPPDGAGTDRFLDIQQFCVVTQVR